MKGVGVEARDMVLLHLEKNPAEARIFMIEDYNGRLGFLLHILGGRHTVDMMNFLTKS